MGKKKKNNYWLKLIIVLVWLICPFYLVGQTQLPKYGVIKGHVWYPSDYLPEMKVCAMYVADTSIKYYIDIKPSLKNIQRKYSLKLPPGVYYVYAYAMFFKPDDAVRAYYTDFVLCGIIHDCAESSGSRSVPLKVKVESGKVVKNIDPVDWYWNEILFIREDTIISIKR